MDLKIQTTAEAGFCALLAENQVSQQTALRRWHQGKPKGPFRGHVLDDMWVFLARIVEDGDHLSELELARAVYCAWLPMDSAHHRPSYDWKQAEAIWENAVGDEFFRNRWCRIASAMRLFHQQLKGKGDTEDVIKRTTGESA